MKADIVVFIVAVSFFLGAIIPLVLLTWQDSSVELTSKDFLQHVGVAACNKLNANERAEYLALVRREKRREKK